MADTVFRIASHGPLVPGNGGPGALNVTVFALAKQNDGSAPYCLANESICAQLGHAIRLPLPQSEIVRFDHTPVKYFASLNFNSSGNTLPPVDAGKCIASLPDLSTGLLLFDILIANIDRHAKNFSVDFLSQPPRMQIFDHSHALFGYQANKGQERLTRLRDHLGISWSDTSPHGTGSHRHCLLDKLPLDDHFDKWINRIGTIPDFLIEEACASAKELGATESEADCAIDFLKYRRDNLGKIINVYRTQFTNITSWSLFRAAS